MTMEKRQVGNRGIGRKGTKMKPTEPGESILKAG